MPLFPLGILLIFGNRSYSRRCPLSGIGNVSAPFLPIPPRRASHLHFLIFTGEAGRIFGVWPQRGGDSRPVGEKPQAASRKAAVLGRG